MKLSAARPGAMRRHSSFTFFLCMPCIAALCLPALAEEKSGDDRPDYRSHVSHALHKIGLNLSDLSLPKLGIPYSTPGRQQAVDNAMRTPLWMVDAGTRISDLGNSNIAPSDYLTELLADLEYSVQSPPVHNNLIDREHTYIGKLGSAIPDPIERKKLADLILRLSDIAESYIKQHPGLDPAKQATVENHIRQLLRDSSTERSKRWLSLAEYHQIGEKYSTGQQAGYLLSCLDVIETFIKSTRLHIDKPVTWDTPLGEIRIASGTDDTHSGHFFILIDTGGNDSYRDVGNTPPKTGFTFVIDLAGNDRITWSDATGPGAGVFGIAIWADRRGDDIYRGRNAGIGVGLFGAGVLWDAEGDDLYMSGSLSQGAGQYGIGMLIDETGNDRFAAELSSQGYGGTGGLGALVDRNGNDSYRCGNAIPDQAEDRIARHGKKHYVSMCQGYSFGQRPNISGGVGLLIDHAGNDAYEADIFAQGGSYWFGLGMLIDARGDDTYSAFEHAQGASLHLGAAFLGDYAGNDSYTSYEHAQGVGIDRAVGILLDQNGNDSYNTAQEAQGTGIKPYGTGILIDSAGNDSYSSQRRSQGYAVTLPTGFPKQQWPMGLFLDLKGKDQFTPLYSDTIPGAGRIQNRQGIAIDFVAGPAEPGT